MLVIRSLIDCKRRIRKNGEYGIGEHGIGEHGIGEHGIGGRGIDEYGIGEHGIGEHGIGEYGTGEHGIGEHGIGEHGIGEMLRHPYRGHHGILINIFGTVNMVANLMMYITRLNIIETYAKFLINN